MQKDVQRTRNEPVPLHLRNAVTRLMKGMGYGKGYKYAHDYSGNFTRQQHLPDSLKDQKYYEPGDQGFEKTVADRLRDWWEAEDDTKGV